MTAHECPSYPCPMCHPDLLRVISDPSIVIEKDLNFPWGNVPSNTAAGATPEQRAWVEGWEAHHAYDQGVQREEIEDCLQAVLNAESFNDPALDPAFTLLIANLRRIGDVTWEEPGRWVVRLHVQYPEEEDVAGPNETVITTGRFRGWRGRSWPIRVRCALLIRGSWRWNAWLRDATARWETWEANRG